MRQRPPYADPGVPDVRGPARYLWWLVRRQLGRVGLGSLWGSVWMVGLMLPPYLVSRGIDDGLRQRDLGTTAWWAGALFAVGAFNALVGMLRHRTMSHIRMDANLRTLQVVVRHAVRLGATLPRRMASGEVVSIGTADINLISQTLTMTGPGVGAVIAYAVVTVLLLQVSPVLGAVVVLGVPLLMILISPLLRRLQRVETSYRIQVGGLTSRAGDIVAGLRVLAGLGGKETFAGRYHEDSRALRDEGYRVGAITSWIEAIAVGLPVVFLGGVTWLGARLAVSGEITVGELVAVYGYVAVLVTPVSSFVEAGYDLTRGLVASRRVIRVLGVAPAVADPTRGASGPPGPSELRDPASGVVVRPGRLLAVAAADPTDSAALLDRLGRYAETDVIWGGVALERIALDEVRRRILVAEGEAHLFAGSVRETLTTHLGHDDAELAAAVHTVAADDVLDALPNGWDSAVETQARNLSGGQRQRLRLARALLANPEVLLLFEPTSAVDAHTEARIADRLHAYRGDGRRTTVVVSCSPLLLDRANDVVHLVGGRVAATGTHAELVAAAPAYRALVFGGEDDEGAA